MTALVTRRRDADGSAQTSPVSGRISIYGGVFRHCRNKDLMHYPRDKMEKMRIAEDLQRIVGQFFGVVGVHFFDYRTIGGPDSGPGMAVGLAESTLIMGAWPRHNGSDCIDVFLHFCGDGENDSKAVACVEALRNYAESVHFETSRLTPHPVHFVTV